MGIRTDARWLHDRLRQIHEASVRLEAAVRARRSDNLRTAARDLNVATTALMRACAKQDLFAGE